LPKGIFGERSLSCGYKKMKKTNPIEENQKLRSDNKYLKGKVKEIKKENGKLRKENTELKKNLDSF